MKGGLLNPQEDGRTSLEMLRLIEKHLKAAEVSLTSTKVDRETYLELFERVRLLRTLRGEMDDIYGRVFRV